MTIFRKLKLNKNFQSMPNDPDDELYPNGIFLFNITKLLAFIKDNEDAFPVEKMKLKTLSSFRSNHLNEAYLPEANLENPIILAEISPGNFNVIDGHHRLEKAYRLGVEEILAYKLSAEQHTIFLTSIEAYHEYVKYWNAKVRKGQKLNAV